MRTAIVTGAASGLGQDVIRTLLADGDDWIVVAFSKSEPPIKHERLHWHAMDLSDDRFRYGMVNGLRGEKLALLVHCSLPQLFKPVLDDLGTHVNGADVMSGEMFMRQRGQRCPV